MGLPGSSAGQESACNAEDPGSNPGLGRSTGERNRLPIPVFLGFPGGSPGKESACNMGDVGWEDSLERERLPTPVFWPRECHGLVHGVAKSQT